MLFWYSNIIIKAGEAYRDYGFRAMLYSHFLVMYCFCYLIFLLIAVIITAVVTLEERKLLASIQSRRGPSKPGYLGLLQPITDAIKLLIKEYVHPRHVSDVIFPIAAILSFFVAAFLWNMPAISFESLTYNNEWTIVVSFFISTIHVFTILFAGWSSASRYGFLGCLRSSAQLIAYDIVVIFVYLNLFIFSKEMSFASIFELQDKTGSLAVFLPAQVMIFFIAMLCENSRHPFDLPEAESELVAGYNVEYSSIRFALFSLAEYSTILLSTLIMHNLFFGEVSLKGIIEFVLWALKIIIIIYIVIKARGLIPRYRYDQLMDIGWKVLIPIECVMLLYNILLYMVV